MLLPQVLLLLSAVFTPTEYDFRAHYTKNEVRISMRDGIHLFTIIYSPKDTSKTYPILLTRTPYSVAPYGPDQYPENRSQFAQGGYILVAQDVRGRFMSEGNFVDVRPITSDTDPKAIDDSTDTYDTIDWLIKNIPNNNGKVGLRGISYPGYYTNTGIINAHPALVAASPQAPMADLYQGDDAYHNGAFFLIANFSFYTDFRRQHNPQLPEKDKDFPYGTKDGYQFYLNHFNYGSLNNPYWADIVNHTTYDGYWQVRNILPHLRNIKPAVLVVGGWYDAEDLSGALKTFAAVQAQSPGTSDQLVMGPWTHGAWARSEFFRDEIEFPFFQHYLKDAPNPALPKAYVFETGRKIWQKQEQWPPPGSVPKTIYLRANRQLSFDQPMEESGFDQYESDPGNPVPFFPKPTLEMAREYMNADQRFVQNRPDVLSYQTELLGSDLTIAGPISPSLFVSTTGTDSDFVVKLIDVAPDGSEELVRGEPFRGKFRHSFEHPEPFQPGAVERIHFTMPDVYHCFGKGHRLMVQIQSSWFPLVDRNPQTFTEIPQAKPADFVKATERIYRERNAPSSLEVKVLPSTIIKN
jgi:uncharacterized protein